MCRFCDTAARVSPQVKAERFAHLITHARVAAAQRRDEVATPLQYEMTPKKEAMR